MRERAGLFLALVSVALAIPQSGSASSTPGCLAESHASSPPPRGASSATHRLTLRLVDGMGAPTEGRISVFDSGGSSLLPEENAIPFYWGFTGHEYFYAADTVSVGVPSGLVTVLVGKGPEFRTFYEMITVASDTTLLVPVIRAFDAATRGWYSGDTHIHLAHGGEGSIYSIDPWDYLLMARGEELSVSCLLDNGLYATGPGAHPASDARHLLHEAVEYRSTLYGHMNILGASSLPPSYGCCLIGAPAAPLNADMVQWAHDHGGLAIYAHPLPTGEENFMMDVADWPYSGISREMPATLVLGGIDAIDYHSYSNVGAAAMKDLYIDLLNLRYRIPLSVGTDATPDRWFSPPVGGFRLYVQCDSLTVPNWLEGLRTGRSFATNGPLIVDFEVNGVRPGEILSRSSQDDPFVQASVTVFSRDPVDEVEVVADGQVLRCSPLPAFSDSIEHTFSFYLPPNRGWIFARVMGSTSSPLTVGYDLLATTSPIWVEVDGSVPARKQAAVDRFAGWIADLEDLVLARTGWQSEAQKQAIWSELDYARGELLYPGESPLGVPRDPGPLGNLRLTASPNPFLASTGSALRVVTEALLPGQVTVRVFDARGRVVRTLFDGLVREPALEVTWDGMQNGVPVASGVYFVRALAAGRAATARVFVVGR